MSDCGDVVLVDGPVTVVVAQGDVSTVLVDNADVTTLIQSTADATLVDSPSVLILQSDGGSGPSGAPGIGAVATVTAGEVIQQYRVVWLDTDNLAYVADPVDLNQTDCVLGVALTAALSGEQFQVQVDGMLNTPAMWTQGPLYLSANGILSSTCPSSGNFLEVAVAVCPTVIIVRPSSIIVLA